MHSWLKLLPYYRSASYENDTTGCKVQCSLIKTVCSTLVEIDKEQVKRRYKLRTLFYSDPRSVGTVRKGGSWKETIHHQMFYGWDPLPDVFSSFRADNNGKWRVDRYRLLVTVHTTLHFLRSATLPDLKHIASASTRSGNIILHSWLSSVSRILPRSSRTWSTTLLSPRKK